MIPSNVLYRDKRGGFFSPTVSLNLGFCKLIPVPGVSSLSILYTRVISNIQGVGVRAESRFHIRNVALFWVQSLQHQMDRGNIDHRFTNIRTSFIILAQPPGKIQPAKSALNNPAFGQHLKPLP